MQNPEIESSQTPVITQAPEPTLHVPLHQFETVGVPVTPSKGSMKNTTPLPLFLGLCLAVILGGTGTGWGPTQLKAQSSNNTTYNGQKIQQDAGENIQNGQVFGSPREDEFKDSAEGFLTEGGTQSEGSHRLLREGGASKTVYMTSSTTDLNKFVGMKVKVWGETQKAEKVGWLMDVGRVQVLETKAEAPADPDSVPKKEVQKTTTTKTVESGEGSE